MAAGDLLSKRLPVLQGSADELSSWPVENISGCNLGAAVVDDGVRTNHVYQAT